MIFSRLIFFLAFFLSFLNLTKLYAFSFEPNDILADQDTLYACKDEVTDVFVFNNDVGGVPNVNYYYVFTDDTGIILNTLASNSFDLDPYPVGEYRMYGLSYSGVLGPPSTGLDITFLNGLPNVDVSNNFIVLYLQNPTIIPDAGLDIFACEGEAINLNASLPSMGTSTWTQLSGNLVGIQDVNNPNSTIIGANAGLYEFIWTTTNGLCTVQDTVRLQVYESPSITTMITEISTVGASDGMIDICVNGGLLPYNISYAPVAGLLTISGGSCDGNNRIVNLPQGSYDIYVEDANGCVDTLKNNVINSFNCDISISNTVSNDALCFGQANGSIDVVMNGSGSAYSYSLDNGSTFSSPINSASFNIDGLANGSYNILVQDNLGCSVSFIATVNEPADFFVLPTVVSNSLNGEDEGSISLCINGGTPPLTVFYNSSNNGSGTFNVIAGACTSNFNLSNLFADNVNLTITDANGCEEMRSFTITEPSCAGFSGGTPIVSNNLCAGDSLASVQTFAAGGTPPYILDLSQGGNIVQSITSTSSSNSFSNLWDGSFDLVIRDQLNCSLSYSVLVEDPMSLSFTHSIVNPSVGASDGSICVSLSGGTSPYNLLSSCGNVIGGPSFSCSGDFEVLNVGEGNCLLQLIDANNCVFEETINITNASCVGLAFTQISPQSPNCFGEANGQIFVQITGGTAPYTYYLNNDLRGTTNALDFDFLSLTSGAYVIKIVDDNGCSISETLTLGSPTAVNTIINLEQGTCIDKTDGILTTTTTGGTLPYMYAWSNGEMTAAISNLGTGNYILTVTDQKGCSQISNYDLPSFFDGNVNAGMDQTIFVGEFANIDATTNLPTGYSISWTPSTGLNNPNILNPEASPITNTLYTIELVSNDGCIISDDINITVSQVDPDVAIPNAFSPNGDSHNDLFKPYLVGAVNLTIVQVYNRWGEKVYEAANDSGWDGNYNGQAQPAGTYVYRVEYTDTNGTNQSKTGELTLFR